MADGLRPLDAQAMAAALESRFSGHGGGPGGNRGAGIRPSGPRWRMAVPPASRAAGDDGLIEALPDIQATGPGGQHAGLAVVRR